MTTFETVVRSLGASWRRPVLCVAAALVLVLVTAAGARAAVTLGGLDSSFGTTGSTLTQFAASGEGSLLSSVASEPDGGLAAVGETTGDSSTGLLAASFNDEGAPDTGFAGQGDVIADFGDPPFPSALAPKVAVQSDGDIVVAGTGEDANGDFELVLRRYLPDGSPDQSFGSSGSVTEQLSTVTPASQQLTEVDGLTIDADGRILVAGPLSAGANAEPEVYVAGFTADGSPDLSFATDGLYEHQYGVSGQSLPLSSAAALLANPDGSVAVAVLANDASGQEHWGVLELDPSGTPVTGFGTAGVSLDPGAGYEAVYPTAIVRSASGDVLVAGAVGTGKTLTVEAFDSSTGAVDTSFGSGGIYQGPVDAQASDAVVQPDGRIDIVGTQSGMSALVIQLVAPGTPNTAFGDDGTATFELQGDPSEALGATLDPSGQLVLAGGVVVNGGSQLDAALARVVVHLPPVPVISTTSTNPTVGQPINLTGSATDPDGTIDSYAWAADADGTLTNAAGAMTTVTFSTPGAHQITLRADDDDGVSASTTTTIDVAAGSTPPITNGPGAPAGPVTTPPACQSTTTTTTGPRMVRIQLHCTDAADQPPTYTIVTPPDHGMLGAIDQTHGELTYTPRPGFHGTDGFSYTAASASGVSTATRVVIDVKPGTPMLTDLAVSEVTSGKPKLVVHVVAATNAPAVKSLMIELPRGLSFRRRDLSTGIITTGKAGTRLPHRASLSHGRLTIELDHGSSTVDVTVSTISVLSREVRRVESHKLRRVGVRIAVTDASGRITRFSTRAQIR